MYDHAEAEHQDDRVHIKCNGVCPVQNVENAVVSEIDEQGIDGVVPRLTQADKDIVDDYTAGVCNIKGCKPDDNGKDLVRISEILRITKKRRPGGNRDYPKHNACGGNEVVVELSELFVTVLAVRADDLGKCGDRNQQPAPDEIVCNPVVALLGNHVHHFADHDGVDKVIHKLLKPRKYAGPAPFTEHRTVGSLETAESDMSLLVKKQNTKHGKQRVCDNIGDRYAVNAEIRDQQEIGNQRQHRADAKKDIHVFVLADDYENYIRKADEKSRHESNRFKAEVCRSNRQVDLARIHGADQHRAVDQDADREECVQNKGAKSRFEGRFRKFVLAILENPIQDRVKRNDQKCLQGLVDQVKPFHLPDDVKRTGLPAGGDQKGFDRLIDCRNQGKRTKGEPQPPVEMLQFR